MAGPGTCPSPAPGTRATPRDPARRRAKSSLPWRRWLGLALATGIACAGVSSASRAQGSEERLFWASVSACTERVEVELYLDHFPEGEHAPEARDCLAGMADMTGLLATCEEHFTADRLTTGEGGTALACYREVLVRQPNNGEALAGLRRIVERYAGWSRSALARGDCGRATTYLNRARSVDRTSREVESLAAEIDRSPACQAGIIAFGDDTGNYARDGECDDFRFSGPGVASSFAVENLGRDATDCRQLHEAGQIWLHPLVDGLESGVTYGDDHSSWPNDGECDDPRFVGPGAMDTPLAADLGHDASDCRRLHREGRIALHPLMGGSQGASTPAPSTAERSPTIDPATIGYGDNSSLWANDGECDDPRFTGPGVASTLVDADLGADANDCRRAVEQGRARLR